jgi:AcrR family transcriptional regulator
MTGARRPRDDAREIFRRAVLDAAEEVFAENGFHGARIQDIAARARVAVGTIYNHFEQKEDVFAALMLERGEEVYQEFLRRPDDPARFEPQFRARFQRVVQFLGRHVAFFRIAAELGALAEGGLANTPFGELHRAQETRMQSESEAMLAQGIAEGALAPHPVGALAQYFSGALRQTLRDCVQAGGDVEARAAWALDLFLRGARP